VKWFDLLVDRYEKRVIFVFAILLLCFFFASIHNFSLGRFLFAFTSMNDFYLLLGSKLSESTLFTSSIRFVIDSSLSMSAVFQYFGEVVTIRTYTIIVCLLLILTAKKDGGLIEKMKLIVLIYIISLIIMYGLSFGFIFVSLQSLSTEVVIHNMNSIGIIFIVIPSLHILLFLSGFLLIISRFFTN